MSCAVISNDDASLKHNLPVRRSRQKQAFKLSMNCTTKLLNQKHLEMGCFLYDMGSMEAIYVLYKGRKYGNVCIFLGRGYT